MSKVELLNFGCRLNIAEGEAARAAARDEDNLIIVNTCAVTNEAERQARQAIRRAARNRPDARIIVTGCAAQIHPERFSEMPEVTRVIGNGEKRDPAQYGRRNEKVDVQDIFGLSGEFSPVASGIDHARAFVEVQNGCDHRCTFCIIPFGRGNSRSAPAGSVIDTIKVALDRGHHEVILTGVDLTSYGHDLPGSPALGLLVERILTALPDLPRLRLSSLDCIEIDDRLFEIVTEEPRLMPSLHLSLQAGDDMILKRMKRRHSRAEAVTLVERIKAKRPDIAIGADIIAGFPTETEEMFANSLTLIEDCHVVAAHIFPFSPREGTPAARMPQIERAIIKERAGRLRIKAAEKRAEWLASFFGTRQRVLVELDGISGHTEHHAAVRLASPLPPKTIQEVYVTGHNGEILIAEAAA